MVGKSRVGVSLSLFKRFVSVSRNRTATLDFPHNALCQEGVSHRAKPWGRSASFATVRTHNKDFMMKGKETLSAPVCCCAFPTCLVGNNPKCNPKMQNHRNEVGVRQGRRIGPTQKLSGYDRKKHS